MGLGIRIHSAADSASALTQVWRVHRSQQSSFHRMASGERVSIAADGAANLAISEKLRVEARSLQVAMRNVDEGTNLVRTASSAHSQGTAILSRMRELAVYGASDLVQPEERAAAQAEVDGLIAELDRIGQSTAYNGLNLTTLTPGSVEVQVGTGASASEDRLTVTLRGVVASFYGVAGVSVETAAQARVGIGRIDGGIEVANSARSDLGAVENQLSAIRKNLQTRFENTVDSESSIRDADFAIETAELSRGQILAQAGVSILSQAGISKQSALSLLQ